MGARKKSHHFQKLYHFLISSYLSAPFGRHLFSCSFTRKFFLLVATNSGSADYWFLFRMKEERRVKEEYKVWTLYIQKKSGLVLSSSFFFSSLHFPSIARQLFHLEAEKLWCWRSLTHARIHVGPQNVMLSWQLSLVNGLSDIGGCLTRCCSFFSCADVVGQTIFGGRIGLRDEGRELTTMRRTK